MQRASPWNIVWPSLVGHLLIAVVLLKALPPATIGATGAHDTIDVVMMETSRIGREEFFRGANAGGSQPLLRARAPLPQRRLRNSSRPMRGTISTSTTETPAAGDALRSSSTSRTGDYATRARILARIYRAKRYPAEARRKQLSGRPVVTFRIRRDGTTTAARIITSSGSAILDTAALETIRRAEPFPYFPDPFPVLINYQLQ